MNCVKFSSSIKIGEIPVSMQGFAKWFCMLYYFCPYQHPLEFRGVALPLQALSKLRLRRTMVSIAPEYTILST